jgi:hypothetical protein
MRSMQSQNAGSTRYLADGDSLRSSTWRRGWLVWLQEASGVEGTKRGRASMAHPFPPCCRAAVRRLRGYVRVCLFIGIQRKKNLYRHIQRLSYEPHGLRAGTIAPRLNISYRLPLEADHRRKIVLSQVLLFSKLPHSICFHSHWILHFQAALPIVCLYSIDNTPIYKKLQYKYWHKYHCFYFVFMIYLYLQDRKKLACILQNPASSFY